METLNLFNLNKGIEGNKKYINGKVDRVLGQTEMGRKKIKWEGGST